MIGVGVSVTLISCASLHKKNVMKIKPSVAESVAAKLAAQKRWTKAMRGMALTLQKLVPYLYSRSEFGNPRNKSNLQKLIHSFAKGVKAVPQHAGEKLLGRDPIVRYAVGQLKTNTHAAEKAFGEGHIEFARTVLRENTGLCFSCHTASKYGPQDNFSHMILPAQFSISPVERADFYVATRQFDRATVLLESELKTSNQWIADPHEQLHALRRYLALEIRVKNKPGRAARFLETLLRERSLPYFIASDAKVWVKSLRKWQREPFLDQRKLIREKVLFLRARKMVRKGRELQASDTYQGGFVDFLRASALLHECLRAKLNAVQKARIYRMLGQSYEIIAENGTWNLPEFYYEACVRIVPKTALAKMCYHDFERTVILGYSGSGGLFVPAELQQRLMKLRRLSGF